MDFSIRMVTDGQKATISITGLNNISNENSVEIKNHLSYAIGLALGIEKPQDSCFINESEPNADGKLEPNTIEIVNKHHQSIDEVEYRNGLIKDIEDIQFIGGDGTKTLIASKNSQNEQNNIVKNEEVNQIVETIVETSTSFDECSIILSLFVDSSKTIFEENRTIINETTNMLNDYRIQNKKG